MFKRIFLLFGFLTFLFPRIWACTSALVGADKTLSGRPILWKNRDTDNTDNKVAFIQGENGDHSYVALFNSQDSLLNEAWMGMNDAGFAIMNTASYNLKFDKVPEEMMDKEGFLMTTALKKCVTVDDFENLLDSLPKPLGVEANFGVIDAYGNGAFFETNNFRHIKFDIKDQADNVMVRTNYSHAGRRDKGYGFIRESNANHLLEPYIEKNEITPELFTENLSRSFWHDLLGRDMAATGDKWIIDQDFIPRYKSTATIVIEGCIPLKEGEKAAPDFIRDQYIMWTGMGYPPCSEILPVYCSEDGVPEVLQGIDNGFSPMCNEVKTRRDQVFPIHKGNGDKYIEMPLLFNEEETGFVQMLVPKNLETYKKYKEIRDGKL